MPSIVAKALVVQPDGQPAEDHDHDGGEDLDAADLAGELPQDAMEASRIGTKAAVTMMKPS
jgi:hypothetical protein